MDRFRAIGVVTTLLLGCLRVSGAQAGRDENLTRCRDDEAADRRVAACTALVESGQESPTDLANAFSNRGDAYLEQGNTDRAILDYDQSLTLKPDDPRHLNRRCYAKAIRNRPQEALVDCNRSLNLRPGDSATLDSRGFTFLRLGFFDAAIADYDAALAGDPRSTSSLYGRGVAKRMKGDVIGGDADISAARKLKPDIVDEMAKRGVQP
jgi:tetratricopeptide (TPR) repeat protein